jgi:hypothetical protein
VSSDKKRGLWDLHPDPYRAGQYGLSMYRGFKRMNLVLIDGTQGVIQSVLTQYPEQRPLSYFRRCFLSDCLKEKQIFILPTL